MMARRYEAYKSPSCGRSSAIISPGSTGRSCWSTRCPRSMPARRRSPISSGADRHPRLLSASAAPLAERAGSAGASTASCSPPPRPTICITPTMTGWRRSSRRSSAAPSSAPASPAPASRCWRSPRSAPPARRVTKGGETLPSSSARRCRARRSTARPSTARPKSRSFPATCRTIRNRSSKADSGGPTAALRPLPPADARRTAEGLTLSLPHIRLDRALEFLIGDRLA